jgi:hypothetical protein
VSQEEDEQRLFPGRERQRPAATLAAPGRQVDPDIAELQGRALRRVATSHQGPGPGQQLLEGERLGQVGVGARVEPAHPVADGVARRQEQHGRLPIRPPEPLHQRQAVLDRQLPVHEHQVPSARSQGQPRRAAVGGVLDRIPLLPQAAGQEIGDLRLIFHHQDPDAHATPRREIERCPMMPATE